MCCSKGKIILEKWRKRETDSESHQEKYAGMIQNMWSQDSVDGRLLREFARPLNNALALASQVVEEKNASPHQHAWMPNVIIKGKLFHKIPYSLRPVEHHVSITHKTFDLQSHH
jgi:hypothetical protein